VELVFEFTPDLLIAFLTLFVLEIVLGVDNVIFISILAAQLPVEQQAKARNLGLTLAMVIRIGLLFAASWIISLTNDLFEIFGMGFSGRDLILIAGGLFLVYKAVTEIHEKLEGSDAHAGGAGSSTATFGAIIGQILLLDIVFSFDSVITAVGMVDNLLVIIVAVVSSFAIMLFAAKHIFTFVNKHPTVKMLALAFLVLIGVVLIADGFDVHIDKALVYGPIAFAIIVEALNLAYKRNQAKRAGSQPEPVHLRSPYVADDESN
jgi:predicted tellurium resistance membrane protein TerC